MMARNFFDEVDEYVSASTSSIELAREALTTNLKPPIHRSTFDYAQFKLLEGILKIMAKQPTNTQKTAKKTANQPEWKGYVRINLDRDRFQEWYEVNKDTFDYFTELQNIVDNVRAVSVKRGDNLMITATNSQGYSLSAYGQSIQQVIAVLWFKIDLIGNFDEWGEFVGSSEDFG